MADMTFPEFEAALATTDICLLPIGAIEERGPPLRRCADSRGAGGQLGEVQAKLQQRGHPTIIGPILNIGITNEATDSSRDGTYIYPGSLTIGSDTFINLYVDLLRSLRANGLKRIFLYSGHLGGRHLRAVAQAAIRASAETEDLKAYALIDNERLLRLDLPERQEILAIRDGLNFPMLLDMLGGPGPAFTTHADGWETSLVLHFNPEYVGAGYAELPQVASPIFLAAGETGDRRLNPSGIGGFPTRLASAEIGRRIAEYRAERITEAILEAVG